MTAALLWKEYRQQRAIWLAFAILAIVLVVGLAEVFGRGSGWQVFQDEQVIWFLHGVVVTMAMAQGVVTGVLLLAGDKEDGTLGFLDSITGRRSPLFVRKLAAGLLLGLTQSLLLVCVALGLRFGSWEFAAWLPLLTLDGLLWGILAGALCRTVMIGVVAGFLAMPLSWLVSGFIMAVIAAVLHGWNPQGSPPFGDSSWFWLVILAKAAVGNCAGLLSWQVYCRDDRARRAGRGLAGQILALLPREWSSLMWLAMRQGRWILVAGAGCALLLAFTVQMQRLILWPVGTLTLGLICGLTVFAPDQKEGNRFLASQRLQPGKVWTGKVLFWGAALTILTGIVRLGLGPYLQVLGAAFVVLWPLYGFCFGLFFGQVTGRPVTAVILSVFVTPLVGVMWAPSLLMGGVAVWQIAIIPLILLVSSRLMAWPVLSERLSVVRPFAGVAGTAALVTLALAGGLWYRAVEVPDVGEPFDVHAFLDELPSPKQNEAGFLMQIAAEGLVQYRVEEIKSLNYNERSKYLKVTNGALTNGWPENDEGLGKRLDHLFRLDWVRHAEKASQMPLGMVQDPRLTDLTAAVLTNDKAQYAAMAEFFAIRAIQVQARGDNADALHLLETALALARQVKNYSSTRLFYSGFQMEMAAWNGLQRWVERIGPDKALLREALLMLQRHEKDVPGPANSIKADFVIHQNGNSPSGVQFFKLRNVFAQTRWEQERETRINRAVTAGLLGENQKPIKQMMGDWMRVINQGFRQLSPPALLIGLPPDSGPGANVSAEQWVDFIEHSAYAFPYVPPPPVTAALSKRLLLASELLVAVALYQAEHGTPPLQLGDLSPAYLTGVPLDPVSEEPFGYRISQGENFKGLKPPLNLAVGQAVIWGEAAEGFYHRRVFQSRGDWRPVAFVLPVPVWKKEQP